MNLPEIAIFNFSNQTDADVQRAVRAVNRQVLEDFMPVWGAGYHSRLKSSAFDAAAGEEVADEPVTADAAIYIVDQAHLAGAAGYHFKNGAEVPYGFVFTETGHWTVTLSHEVLELIVDPMVNCFVPGADPRPNRQGTVLHAYEVCDAVERTSYVVDGVAVSNFVTPQYFSEGDTAGTRNDFLGTSVPSFGVLPGCHLGFIDLAADDYVIYSRPGTASDTLAALPKARAKQLKSAVVPEPRLPDAMDDLVGNCASGCSNKRIRKIVERSLRRNGYRHAGEAIRAAVRGKKA